MSFLPYQRTLYPAMVVPNAQVDSPYKLLSGPSHRLQEHPKPAASTVSKERLRAAVTRVVFKVSASLLLGTSAPVLAPSQSSGTAREARFVVQHVH